MTTVSITCEVDVDIYEVFEELTTKQRTDFLSRCNKLDRGDVGVRSIIRDAVAMIRRGEALDAARFLEAEFFPKWQSIGECLAAAKKSMANN